MSFSETFVSRVFRRAAVVVPPLRDFYFTRHRFSSLGAEIAATLLRREGLQVDLLNFPLMNVRGTVIEMPEALDYLKPHILPEETGRLSYFTRFRRFGPPADACAAAIEALRPDICFLSLFAFAYADDALELAERIRSRMPAVPLAAGGAGVSVHPGYFLRNPAVDFALCGEAETCLVPFFRELSVGKPDFTRVPNMAWKENGAIRVSPLRSFASGKDIEVAAVKTSENARSVCYATSLVRGCPKRCDFCSSVLLSGGTLRTPPLERLDQFIAGLRKNAGGDCRKTIINLEDDNLLADGQFLAAAVSLFRKHLPGVEFFAENGIDYSLLAPAWCGFLAENGMKKFNLSLASGSYGIAEKHGRSHNLGRYENVLSFLTKKNIPSITYFICGFKEDTIESTADNLIYLSDKQTVIGISLFYPTPGLPDFSERAVFDRTPSFLCLGSAAFPWNGSLSTATMITAFRLSRYLNLKRSGPRSDAEKRLLEITENRHRLHTMVKRGPGGRTVIEVPCQDIDLVEYFFRGLK